MEANNYNKYFGYGLLGIFGSVAIGGLYDCVVNLCNLYNPTVNPIIWGVVQLIAFGSSLYMLFSKKIKSETSVKCGLMVVSLLFCLYTITNVVGLFTSVRIFDFMGQYASLILELIMLGAMALVLLGSKVWSPVKVVGLISYIPALFSSIIFSRLMNAWELYEQTLEYDAYEKLLLYLKISGGCSLILKISVVVLILIWISKRPIAPSIQNQTLESI